MTTTVANSLDMPKWALITFGLLSVIAGVLALAWPGMTILVLVAVLGIQLLIYGVFMIVNAFKTGQGRVLAVIFGVLAFIAGTALFLQPLRNLPAVVIVLSVFWVVGGLVQTIGSIVDRDEHWVLELLSGLLSIGAGVVAIVWPEITLFAVAITAGIWMIMIGVMRLIAAFSGPGRAAVPAV